jgi:hypothetical protein
MGGTRRAAPLRGELTARDRIAALCLALACALPAAAAARADPTFRVGGQCRDGAAQGGYTLHAGDGRLRVQGAFSQGQRVGSFIFWSTAGVRVAHLPFDADELNGTVSLWYPDARPATEAPRKSTAGYRNGRRHGLTRSWYPGGRLRAESDYADGSLVSARAWSETGRPYDEARAREIAERDRAADVEYVDTLLALVRRHMPDCTPPPAQQPA